MPEKQVRIAPSAFNLETECTCHFAIISNVSYKASHVDTANIYSVAVQIYKSSLFTLSQYARRAGDLEEGNDIVLRQWQEETHLHTGRAGCDSILSKASKDSSFHTSVQLAQTGQCLPHRRVPGLVAVQAALLLHR